MTLALAIQLGVGAFAAMLGLPLVLVPARAARALHAGDVEAGRHASRIAGVMLTMLGIILIAFAAVAAFAQVR